MGLLDFLKRKAPPQFSWVPHERIYEGFPLFLRRCTSSDTPENRRAFSLRVSLTHELTEALQNGLPEPTYNRGLADFDAAVWSAFSMPLTGVPVLIETFGGRRIYYFYVLPDTDVSAVIARLAKAFPGEKLTGKVKVDSEWKFLASYSKDLWLDENGDVLAQMQAMGDNLDIPRDMNFAFVFGTQSEAERFVAFITGDPEFEAEASSDQASKIWQAEVTHFMMPTHGAITELEDRLAKLAAKYGGEPDGWGSFKQP